MNFKNKRYLIDDEKLLKEWNQEKNEELNPANIELGSHKKVWWQCSKGHDWQAIVSNRVLGKGCPYCAGQKVWIGFNDLSTTRPDLANEWHPMKNGDLTPQEVSAGSKKKVWWQCSKGHEWEARINSRTSGSGCPCCSGRFPILGETDLATTHPELAKEWHLRLNKELTPQDVSAGSNKKVWWQCSNGHEWETKVSHRTRGSGCVYCAGQKVWEGFNDLATTYPGLVTEWHPTKNGDSTPQDVSAGSNKKVWWQCSKGHEWKAALAHRKNGTQCPVCNSNGTSHPEQCLLFYLSKVFPNAQNRYRLGSDEIDLLIPEIGLVIEYDGVYWHRLKLQKDIEKSQRLKSFYKILRIREEGLPLFKLEGVDCMVTTGHEKDLSTTIDKVFDFILKNFNLEPLVVETISNVVVDLEKDWINILENYRSYEYKNSLAVLHPELVKQWHPIKNGQLKPENFRSHSMEKVWWQCSKGHEWRAIIDSRSKSRGCPYCANKLVWAGFNDLATIHPELEKEWHPTKNADLTPQQVTIGSGKKIWWQCSKGHEWQVPVSHRTSKNTGCPYCSGYYPILGENDLGTTHPELIKEWHPTKNEHLAPQDVSAGSNKKVWWQCSKNHEWEATIANRTSNQTGCPYCSGKSVLNGFNDLATFEPILAKEWHLTKNGDLSPQDVSTGSNKKVWWQCSKNHEWEAVINSRSEGRGCPYCAGRYAIVGETDLTTTHPDLAKQWHPTKNGHLTPEDVLAGSNKKVWWRCAKGHEWKAMVHKRTEGKGCPYCSGRYPILGETDLATTHPELAKQWHPTKNEHLAPHDVSAGSNKKVWWQCSKNHEWEANVANRTSNQTGCPYCSGKSVLNGFNDLATFEPILAKEWHLTKNGDLSPQDVSTGSNKKVWWQCQSGYEWRKACYYRASNPKCPNCKE